LEQRFSPIPLLAQRPVTMYQIFGQTSVPSNGIAIPPSWHYVQTGLKHNLDRVITYYRDNPMVVKSNHFLIRLLQSLNIPLGLPLDRYVANVENIALNLSMHFKMTSSIYRGQFFENVFYGGNYELLIASDASFDMYKAHQHWEQLSPVTVLRNNVTSLDMRLPDGSVTDTRGGISVVLINIPLLALQYRAWMLREMAYSEQTGNGMRAETAFIHGYVLPNMLGTQLDQVLFNRLKLMVSGGTFDGPIHQAHPFVLTDYSARLDEAQEQMLTLLERSQQLNFGQMLQAVPAINKANLLQVMHLPDLAPTFQLMWALSIERLTCLAFLFEMAPGGAAQKNRQIMSKILSDIRNYRRNSIMKTLPAAQQEQIDQEMNFLVDHSGSDASVVDPVPGIPA
jgi:hypothetical protein